MRICSHPDYTSETNKSRHIVAQRRNRCARSAQCTRERANVVSYSVEGDIGDGVMTDEMADRVKQAAESLVAAGARDVAEGQTDVRR